VEVRHRDTDAFQTLIGRFLVKIRPAIGIEVRERPSSAAFTTLNTAVVAPMPNANASIAISVPLFFEVSERRAASLAHVTSLP
jgi:hypothetical protein